VKQRIESFPRQDRLIDLFPSSLFHSYLGKAQFRFRKRFAVRAWLLRMLLQEAPEGEIEFATALCINRLTQGMPEILYPSGN
jgi:hypothetical protein